MSTFMEYPKIESVFKRDERGHFMVGRWTTDVFETLADVPWLWTEKIDGTNTRIRIDPKLNYKPSDRRYETQDSSATPEVEFGGRTANAQMPMPLLDRLHDLFATGTGFAKILQTLTGECILYGEGFGGKIQKGSEHYGEQQDFILFDVFVPDDSSRLGGFWLKREDVVGIASGLGIRVVPEFAVCTLRQAVEFASAGRWRSSFNPTLPPEGIVGQPVCQLFDRRGHRVITKVKHRDFAHVRVCP